MRIALDVMGGDHAPTNPIEGAKLALESLPQLERLYLVGEPEVVEAALQAAQLRDRRVEVVPASQVIAMTDASTDALRAKKDSSISVAVDLVRSGECSAIVSAGHTGASVAAATVRLKRLRGIDRPGIASPLPNEFGMANIVDAGANPEAKPQHLFQYAIMGHVYARQVLHRERPIIGLMSIGEEDEKGTELTREVFRMLKQTDLNFRGNIEGHDLFETQLDVVVCDGFTGNVLLKACEATAKVMFKWIKAEIHRSTPLRKLGALMARDSFRKVKERGNYETYGGSPLLGVNGVVIIGHGSSSALAIKNAIRVATEAVRHELNPHIEAEVARLS